MNATTNERSYKLARGSFVLNIMALIFAFLLVLIFVCLSALLFYLGRIWIGSSTVVMAFISFVGIFVRHKSDNGAKRNTKNKQG